MKMKMSNRDLNEAVEKFLKDKFAMSNFKVTRVDVESSWDSNGNEVSVEIEEYNDRW